METRNKYLCPLEIIFLPVLFYCGETFSQENFNLTAGIGLPELLNGGLRYQFEQVQLGANFGFLPGENLISFSGDVYYHFAGHSKFSKRKIWFGKVGINYSRDESETEIVKYLFLVIRTGLDINFSEKMGMNVDAGVLTQLMRDETEIKQSNESSSWFGNVDTDIPILPVIGVSIFYRF